MGTGMCSRRQKGLLQTAFCLVTLACLGSGVFMYNHLQQKVRNAEALAQKYKQQQEALSAQLQVVYEHRSRLERSLQKERGEHKKTKEDFLVYKLEAQEALNKEKQDSMNRYGALSSQHKILKNQHEDVKKQLLDLQLQHNSLKLEHRKTLESHSQKYAQLQQEKDSEVTNLQDTVFKLREESKLLRKAHQEVHSQLLNAQAQMEEFRQLKEALQKMPSFKGGGGGAGKGQQQFQVLKEQPMVPANSQLQLGRQKAFPVNQENRPVGNALASPVSGVQKQADSPRLQGHNSYSNDSPRPQANVLFTHPASLQDANALPEAMPAWPARHGDGHVIRFTRTMNSLPNGNPDLKMVMRVQVKSNEDSQAPGLSQSDLKQPSAAEEPQMPDNHHSTGNKQAQIQSWKDIVNKVNAQMDEEQVQSYPKSLHFDPKPGQEMQKGSPQPPSQKRGEEHQIADQEGEKERTDDEELEMDAGVIERENLPPQKETVVQEPMMPDDAADPAQDPNNQGEDEFEEAELERPDFEEKVGGLEKFKEPSVKDESKEKPLKDAGRPAKPREDPMDDYQEDQEQEIEDHGGEVDDNDDLELVQDQKDHAGIQGADGKKDIYY
ncbi:Golgi integral membrane protein 4-like isoform X1 [Athene cunicularia]|uniref:Golgi integral membrane protein 4-like n=1 Tax=Athene cunicularia TaxID=194338 RepID=A0A663LV48_ATHCN|nr:Golgi integral membrane protein 4-like isoform X1 [Athene cunicularia]